VTIKSTPVRNYEEFAKNVLKVDPEVCISKREAFPARDKKIFFCRMTVDHPGTIPVITVFSASLIKVGYMIITLRDTEFYYFYHKKNSESHTY